MVTVYMYVLAIAYSFYYYFTTNLTFCWIHISDITYIGIKYLQPPILPHNHIKRQELLNEMVNKLMQATIEPNKYGATLAVVGAGGFGKTSVVTSLCYHPL